MTGTAGTGARILLRSTTSPFEVLSPELAIKRKTIASNSGNLLFLHAAYRILAADGVTVEVDHLKVRPEDADRINTSYDAYVVPFANAFRPQYEPTLLRWAELVEQLRIPVVVLGVGAQSTIDGDLDRLSGLDATVRRFVAAVLKRSPSIGVRGDFTAEYLGRLGFRGDLVRVIGCPSVFINGPRLHVAKRVRELTTDSPIAVNGAPYQAAMGPIIRRHHERYRDMVYVAQDPALLELLTLGETRSEVPKPDGFPNTLNDPMIIAGRARIYLSPFPWMALMRTRHFTFGARLHGNLAAIMAGTPAYILAHDSRTLEVARYFEIPHRPLADVGPGVDAAELYADADYSRTNAGHPERWARFAGYLADNGLGNAFDSGEATAFDERIASLAFPTPGDPASWTLPGAPHPARPRGRLRRLRAALRRLTGAGG